MLAIGVLATGFLADAQPKPKSNDEVLAVNAMFKATDPDSQIAAANTLLEKFADTQFKGIALQIISADYQRKGDFPKCVTYGERAIEADPNNYRAMIVLGQEYARTTKDSDFDKDDKLKKADGYANGALTAMKTAVKLPNMPQEMWDANMKADTSDAHDVLAQVAVVRKKYDVAIAEFTTAISFSPDAVIYARLANADNLAGKYDDAIAAAQKAMDTPNVSPVVRNFAQAERARAMVAKNKSAAPATPAPAAPKQ
jgi:tetratricopeptide (TPR) repeat protein